jgi:hypothetical protein
MCGAQLRIDPAELFHVRSIIFYRSRGARVKLPAVMQVLELFRAFLVRSRSPMARSRKSAGQKPFPWPHPGEGGGSANAIPVNFVASGCFVPFCRELDTEPESYRYWYNHSQCQCKCFSFS